MRSSGPKNDWIEREGFVAISAEHLLERPAEIRDAMGVYMIFLRNVGSIFARSSISRIERISSWSVGDHQHCYTGESVAIRSRAILHLCGSVRDSGVREILLALQHADNAIWPDRDENLNVLEMKLTGWLTENAIVAFRPCSYVRDVERDLISRMPSPLNLRGNTKSLFASALKAKRDNFRAHLKTTGQIPQSEPMTRSERLAGRTTNHLAGEPSEFTRPCS
jgi:hypothetical protein